MATNEKRVNQSFGLEWIRLGQTKVSQIAQRERRDKKIDKLVADFDPDEFGVPVVSFRQGDYYVIDGQHRIEAMKRWLGNGWEDQRVHCQVYSGLTEKEEADKFLRRNDVLTVSTYDKFQVGLTAGHKTEIGVQRVVKKVGLVITRDKKVPGAVSAVGALCKVYTRSSPRVLEMALTIIRDAWGDQSYDMLVIDGIGRLCQRYQNHIDIKRAVEKLGGIHAGVRGLLNRAEQEHQISGLPKGECVASAAVDIYNAKSRKGRLSQWHQPQNGAAHA